MIAELIDLAAAWTDAELEDELCTGIGLALTDLDDAPIDDHVAPRHSARPRSTLLWTPSPPRWSVKQAARPRNGGC
jgi:hypothetical protein